MTSRGYREGVEAGTVAARGKVEPAYKIVRMGASRQIMSVQAEGGLGYVGTAEQDYAKGYCDGYAAEMVKP